MSHQDEEKLLLEAAALRAKARKMREQRLEDQRISGLKKTAERVEAEKKAQRDKELRDFLLPLSRALMATGYRIKNNDQAYNTFIATKPVMRLVRTNIYPNTPIDIYWKDGFIEQGFYWD